MAVTIAPSVEAMQALVARINSAETYCLDVVADYGEELIDDLPDTKKVRADVIHQEEEQLEDTLNVTDRTSHLIRVWVRKKLNKTTNDELDPMKLIFRQIFERLNDFNSSDRRVTVWQCDLEPKEIPDKDILRQLGLFQASMLLRVEVSPS